MRREQVGRMRKALERLEASVWKCWTSADCGHTNYKACMEDLWRATRDALGTEEDAEVLQAASPDDIRALGWMVAVHNDYRQDGERFTFWLFTKDQRYVKGEGRTDAEALTQIRAALRAEPENTATASPFKCYRRLCTDPIPHRHDG